MRNLRIAFAGEKDLSEIQILARESFRRTGANLISAAHTARLSPEKLRKVLKVENIRLLEDAHTAGQGVVILLAHMGNWEILSRMIHLFPAGSRAGAFYRPLNNPLLDQRLLSRRQKDGTRMFSKRDPFHQITGFLREGGIVGVLADQRVGLTGEFVNFFGRLTRASPLPSLLARRSKSTVIAMSLTTTSPGKWKVICLPVQSPATTAHCMEAVEEIMHSSPVDVFWLQERWRPPVRGIQKAKHPGEWMPPDSGTGTKPQRVLLWLLGGSPDWTLPKAWNHPDLTYEAVLAGDQSLPESLPESIIVHRIEPALESIEVVVRRIDFSSPLPLDYILTPQLDETLSKAAASESIPVFHLIS